MIKNFTPRLYQETILATAAEKNTLVVLPTGLGKTNVFLMLAAQRLMQYPTSKILLLGPTKPLIDQYFSVFSEHFDIPAEKMAVLTGNVRPDERARLWEGAQVIFSTPQGLENDIITRKINLEVVSLLGFDEAHKAVGNYSYVWVADQYGKLAKFPRIIGMTASPGSTIEKITEICKNLQIEAIEVRTEEDPDVKPYINPILIRWLEVELPESMRVVQKYLHDCFLSKITDLSNRGLVQKSRISYITKKDMLILQAGIQAQIAQGERDYELMKGLSVIAEAVKVQHALELLESQSVYSVHQYMLQLQSAAQTTNVKAVQNLVRDLNFRSALIKIERLMEEGVEHPKLARLAELVAQGLATDPGMKVIIFTQFRDSGSLLVERVGKIPGAKPVLFVGQLKKKETGLSQKEQKRVLDDFREGTFNILVATQIAEEGLDIPRVERVIFYEPIPSAIRTIQRRGRTGRHGKGEMIVLVAKHTRDEAYKWSALHKEKKMHALLTTLKQKVGFLAPVKQTLKKYVSDEKITIFADHREKAAGVIKELIELGVEVRLERLEVADYLASENVAVEMKIVPDFVNSLIDGRLLSQCVEMKRNFSKPVMIIEGTEDIYGVRNVHPNAIRGLLATITVDYGIPILFSRNAKESASYLYFMAKHEQIEHKREVSLHGDRKPQSMSDQQEFVISTLPGVGGGLAKSLLSHFGSVKAVVNAPADELKEVALIGDKKAEQIKQVTDSEYKPYGDD